MGPTTDSPLRAWQPQRPDDLIMLISMGTNALDRFRLTHAHAIERVRIRGNAEQWGLTTDLLVATLHESVIAWTRGLGSPPAEGAVAGYLDRLNAEDLVLACACRAGITTAWDHFVTHYRGMLQAAARAMIHDEPRARDLADSLYAELYGLEVRAGERRSLLSYFHGRSSLRTWLKAVVAQRFVDDYRAHQRAASIGEAIALEQSVVAAPGEDRPDPDRARYVTALGEAVTTALNELKPRDRMRLNFYHLEQLTLKEIGRIMGEYESSVSRRLTRTRTQLRRRIEQVLRREKGLNEEQIRLCYDYALEAWPVDLSRVLSGSFK